MTTANDKKTADIIARWLKIWAQQKPELDAPWLVALDDDIEHSALLGRLLDGLEPLVQPPPLRDGQPDYIGGNDPCVTCGHPRMRHKDGAGACREGDNQIYSPHCRCQAYIRP